MNEMAIYRLSVMLQRNALIVMILTCLFHIKGVGLGCSPSETLRKVPSCPISRKEIMEAALRLNCKERFGDHKYMYHCLPDNKMEHLFEVCAPKIFIIGRRCAEYNCKGDVIQANRYNTRADCSNHTNPCPNVYNSTDAYKYQQCFPRPYTNNGFTPKEISQNLLALYISSIIPKMVFDQWSAFLPIQGKGDKLQRRLQQVEKRKKTSQSHRKIMIPK